MKAVLDELAAIERQLWSNEAQVYAATFLPEAVLIFPEVVRISLDQAVEAIREENAGGRFWVEIAFCSPFVVEIAPEVCLLTYNARARWNDRNVADHVHCLTVYTRREGRWRVAAHQQTEKSTD